MAATLCTLSRSQPDLQQGEDGLSGVRTGVHALALELAAMKGEVEALKAQDAVQRQALEDARSLLGALRLRVEAQELEVNTARAQVPPRHGAAREVPGCMGLNHTKLLWCRLHWPHLNPTDLDELTSSGLSWRASVRPCLILTCTK